MKFSNSYFESEVREGFFVSSMMKRAWAAQLEVLEDVDRICRKHQIPYFADWGTLIGAVRHRGFIPWDDDLDICMKREDYDRFLSVAEEELPENYVLVNLYTTECSTDMFTRVSNSGQINFRKEFLEKFHGCPYSMGIDVFVMDHLPASQDEEEIWLELMQTVMGFVKEIDSGVSEEDAASLWAGWVETTFQVKIDPKQSFRRQLLILEENLFALYNTPESKELTVMQIWMKNIGYRMPDAYYQEAIYLPFENAKIPVPAVYNTVLSCKYGDYMEQIRTGGAHEYPFYREQEEILVKELGENPYVYVFKEEDLKRGERKNASLKKQARDCLQLMQGLHDGLTKNGGKDSDTALNLLAQCQENAIGLGTLIEQEKGTGTAAVKALEAYCETVYRLYQETAGGESKKEDFGYGGLTELENRILPMVKAEIDLRYEAVFLPFKASAWDTMESVFLAAEKDPDCTAYVIPVPYVYKNPDRSAGKTCYEAELFPEYVPITRYDAYNFAIRRPDVIYFQNPYDEYDFAMSVHPFFYAKNLKQYTENLVYLPYFVIDEVAPDDKRAAANLRYCCAAPGVVHADRVIVQSEGVRQIYIELLTEFAGEETRRIWEEKVLGLGSPKKDRDAGLKKEAMDLPDGWLDVIEKPDGSYKRVMLYGTDASVLINYGKKFLEKIRTVFEVLKERKEDAALIWIPGEGMEEAAKQGGPGILKEFQELIRQYKKEGWGILAAPSDAERAALLCDAYYGDGGYLAQMCVKNHVPVMIQDVGLNAAWV